MKCYLDENLSPRVAEIASGQCELDVITAHDAGLLEAPDDLHLRYAASEGRCLVTRDRDDFLALTVAFYEAQAPHAGVLIVSRTLPNDRFAAIAASLCAFAERFPCGMQPYEIAFSSDRQ